MSPDLGPDRNDSLNRQVVLTGVLSLIISALWPQNILLSNIMSKIRRSHTKKQNAASNTKVLKRDVRQAFATKTNQRRSVKAKLAQLTMQVDNQHAELQAAHQLVSTLAKFHACADRTNISEFRGLLLPLRPRARSNVTSLQWAILQKYCGVCRPAVLRTIPVPIIY